MSIKITDKLAQLGLKLPEVAKPVAAYVPALAIPYADGILVRTSGQLPMVEGVLSTVGKVGAKEGQVDLEVAVKAAQICALNTLAAAASTLDNQVDRIKQVLKVTVFVNSDPDFTGQALVANGASNLFSELFTQGHIRSAVGVAVLPLDAVVEVEAEFLAC